MNLYPSPYELKYFLEVASSLNVSRAAVRLGITQPALTHALKRLESALGTDLFIREKTGMRLTRAGTGFVLRARRLLDEWDRIREGVGDEESRVQGRFSVGCHPSVALYSLPKILPRLLGQCPDLEVRLSHDLSRRITEEVIACRTDFGVVVNPVAHPVLVIHELCRDEVGFWIAPGGAEDTLIMDPDLLQTQFLVQKSQKSSQEKFRRTITSSSLEVVASLTASGCGVGILPERVAKQSPRAKLKPFRADLPTYRDRICVVYRPELRSNAGARAILAAITAAGI